MTLVKVNIFLELLVHVTFYFCILKHTVPQQAGHTDTFAPKDEGILAFYSLSS